jgi:endonuclease/exonuclease/phosphatase family metal-dependent hydrolase
MTHISLSKLRQAIFMLACLIALWPQAVVAAEPLRLKAITFNIRYDTSGDNENRWAARREWVADLIRRSGSDFVGIQEALPNQIAELVRLLPEYQSLALSREADPKGGEATPIFYRAQRWTMDPEQHGTFWLSDTPDQPGSITWKNACPRIVTWARFVDKASGRSIHVYNTHFDHRSEEARQKSAAMLMERVAQLPANEPVLITGDLNSGEDGIAIQILSGKKQPSSLALLDTFRAVHADITPDDAGTFHGFKGVPSERKIDFIFVRPEAKVLAAEILREHYLNFETQERSDAIIREYHGERYPSDHFPVTAEVVYPG